MPKISEEIYREIKRYALKLARRGYVTAHGGNISIRSGNVMWITRHASSLENLRFEDVIQVYVDKPSSFDALASTETIVHRKIYLETPNLAVIHAHPPNTVALTFFYDEITPLDSEAYYVLRKIPVVEGSPGSEELALNVAEKLKTYYAVAVRAHGVFTAAKYLNIAYQYMCMVEHSSKIILLVESLKNLGLKFTKPRKF